MNLIEVIVLGILQGLTEFIPVSSSGHLVVAHEIFGTTSSSLSFDVALHVGTLLALIIYFWRDIVNMLTNVFKANQNGRLARYIIVATLPAAIIGFLLEGYIDDHLRRVGVVIFNLIFVALLMLWVDKRSNQNKELNGSKAVGVGVAQAAALVPGISRSGATIVAGRFFGLSRVEAARFSFLLAVPIIAASAVGVLWRSRGEVSGELDIMLVGGLVAFVVGWLAIKFLMSYLTKHSLAVFAWYRLVLAAGLTAWLIFR